MDHLIYQVTDLLNQATGHNLAARNAVLLAVCIVLYGVFLNRDKGAAQARIRRPMRCPDSVLRGCITPRR